MFDCGPVAEHDVLWTARDTVLTNRQTEKLNFDTNYITRRIINLEVRVINRSHRLKLCSLRICPECPPVCPLLRFYPFYIFFRIITWRTTKMFVNTSEKFGHNVSCVYCVQCRLLNKTLALQDNRLCTILLRGWSTNIGLCLIREEIRWCNTPPPPPPPPPPPSNPPQWKVAIFVEAMRILHDEGTKNFAEVG
jgi:hypothetical protein